MGLYDSIWKHSRCLEHGNEPRVPKVRGVCLLGEEPFASQEELCPVELVAFRLSGDDLELDIGLTKCNSVLINYFNFHFDFS